MCHFYKSHLISASMLILALFFTGCGGSDGSNNDTSQEQDTPTGQAILGPLANATVEVYALSMVDSTPVYVTTTSISEDLNRAGLFSVPSDSLVDSELYLLKVIGGQDLDADDDGFLDPQPTANHGAIHALLTPKQIRDGGFHVSILTEILFQRLWYLLAADYPKEKILAELNRRAGVALAADVDGDGDKDGDDIAAWHPIENVNALRHDWSVYQPLISQIHKDEPLGVEALALTDIVLGTVTTPDPARGVAVSGSFAYVAAGDSGLQVIDISNPAHPLLLATLSATNPLAVTVVGTYAYVAGIVTGLQVIDVSNPAHPVLLTSRPATSPRAVTVVGTYAYVVDQITGLQVFDISNPRYPTLLSTLDIPGAAQDIEILGSLAFVAAGSFNNEESGLRIIDISNPINPILLSKLNTPGTAQDVAVMGSLAFVADGEMGLQVIDISSPVNPILLTTFDTPGSAGDIEVAESLAYVAGDAGLQVIDFTDLANPLLLDTFDTSHPANDIDVMGSLAYLADDSGLQVMDVSNPVNSTILGTVNTAGLVKDVKVAGGFAYVANKAGLQIIDVSKPANSVLLGTLDLSGTAQGVEVAGSLAVVANQRLRNGPIGTSGLRVVDIRNPSRPILLGTLDSLGDVQDIELAGSLAYIAGATDGVSSSAIFLQISDISDPTMPVQVGTFSAAATFGGFPFSTYVKVANTLSYLGSPDSLRFLPSPVLIIDSSNPSKPTLIGGLNASYPEDIELSEPLAYVAAANGLQVIDISNPINPIVIGTLESTGLAQDIELDGSLAYMATGPSGLQIIDISESARPVLLYTLDLQGPVNLVELAANKIYVTTGNSSFHILPTVVRKIR